MKSYAQKDVANAGRRTHGSSDRTRPGGGRGNQFRQEQIARALGESFGPKVDSVEIQQGKDDRNDAIGALASAQPGVVSLSSAVHPETGDPRSLEVLGHETAHALAGGGGPYAIDPPDDPGEVQADGAGKAFAAYVAGGMEGPAPRLRPATGGVARVQRFPDPNACTEQEGGHVFASGTANVSIAVGTDMTAAAGLRAFYSQSAAQITQQALDYIAANGGTPQAIETAAQEAVQARNDLKVLLRARGNPVIRALAEARNLNKYGDAVGPSYDDLIRAGKTPEDIVGGVARVSEVVNTTAATLRVVGGFLIVASIAISVWEVAQAPEDERGRTAAGAAGGLAGGFVGAELGAEGGAEVGGAIGTLIEPGGGTAIGAAIGGIVGGLLGAFGAGYAGQVAAEDLYDHFGPDAINMGDFDLAAALVDAQADARIRAASGSMCLPPDLTTTGSTPSAPASSD